MMKIRKHLNEDEQEFVKANRDSMTMDELTAGLGFKSPYKVYMYLRGAGIDWSAKTLNDTEKQFVRDNYMRMTESEMARQLKITRFYIQKFKRAENLKRRKDSSNGVVREGFFDVDERKDGWVA